MRFLVDAQLPPALARQLAAEGFEAEHVSDCGLAESADEAIWQYAEANAAVVITKDEDFARRRILSNDGPQIVWIRIPNTRKRELLRLCESLLPEFVPALERGEPLVEVAKAFHE